MQFQLYGFAVFNIQLLYFEIQFPDLFKRNVHIKLMHNTICFSDIGHHFNQSGRRSCCKGRNPATGATIQIPAKRVVKFRVAKAAKDAILGAK